MMKRWIMGSVGVTVLILGVTVMWMNQTVSLAETKGIPKMSTIQSASITSPRHFDDTDASIYVLDESEVETLRQVLSEQQVNRKYVQLEDDYEYFLILTTNREELLLRISEERILNERTNDVYEFRSGELGGFIETMKGSAAVSQNESGLDEATHDGLRNALNLTFKILRAMERDDETYIAIVSSSNVTVEPGVLRFSGLASEQEFIKDFPLSQVELQDFVIQEDKATIQLGMGTRIVRFLYVEGGSEGYLLYELQTASTVEEENVVDLERKLINSSSEIVTYLQNEDFEKLAEKVDPVDGITFALFADFGAEPGYGGEYVNLSRNEIKSAADQQFVWGYDDSDKEYKMTLKDYVNEMLLKLNGEEVTYEEITFNQSAFEYGGVINTIHENYPDAKYVEYYAPDKSGENRSFQSIRFIFQERDGIWYLIGISRDVATG